MDVQNSSIKHLPVKVNNCVKRRQEDANKTSKWSVFSIYLKKFHKKMFYLKEEECIEPMLCCISRRRYHLMHSRHLVNRKMVTLQEVKM